MMKKRPDLRLLPLSYGCLSGCCSRMMLKFPKTAFLPACD
ncbi:unnamed protein product [Brassica oleracea]